MSKEKFHPKHPAYICSKVSFAFYNNDDADFKHRALKNLCKELRKEFNISATVSEEQIVDNPEEGAIVLALTSPTLESGRGAYDKVLAYLDANAPGRITGDEPIAEEF